MKAPMTSTTFWVPAPIKKHLLLAFLFSFAFICFYWLGLPTDFNSDHITINLRGVNASTYSDLFLRTLNPLSPAWFYPPDRMMEFLRPLQFLWMKSYFDLFADSLIPFHLTAAVGAGLLSALFFFLIYRWTGSKLFAWLAVILYTSFPTNYYTLTSTFSGDFQPTISILSITALLLLSRLTFERSPSFASFLLQIMGWVLAIWLAIKLKSSEKILPLVCLGFFVWRFRFITTRIGLRRLSLLIVTALAMIMLVIPFKTQSHTTASQPGVASSEVAEDVDSKDKTTLSFHWKNMLQRTFFVAGGEFPLTTLCRKKIPRSLTENMGFFIGWLFWLNLLLLPWILSRFRKKSFSKVSMDPARLEHEFWILLIWFAATVAGFANGLTVDDTRFLNFAYVPGVLLFFMGMGVWSERFEFLRNRRSMFRWVLTGAILFTAIPNYGFYTGISKHFAGMQWVQVEAEKDLFREAYGKEPGPWEIYLKHSELEQRFRVIDWYNLPADWFETARAKIEKEGLLYFFSRSEDAERLESFRRAGYRVTLWNRYNFYDAPTGFMRYLKLLNFMKLKVGRRIKKHEVIIYRIDLPA